MGGVFAALNKGEGVTAGLKKVEKSEMTHKNPGLRAGGLVPTGRESFERGRWAELIWHCCSGG